MSERKLKDSPEHSRWRRLAATIGPWAGGIGAVLAIWAWVVPADWVRPQSLWTTPKPRIAAADVVRRWPSLGVEGVRDDSALIQIHGYAIQQNLPESGCRLVVFWRLVGSTDSAWHVGCESSTSSAPASVPMSVLTAGPWELSVTVTCPKAFRGEIESRPLVLSQDSVDDVTRLTARESSLAVLPEATAVGNRYLVETSGVTEGEPASPYRQIAQLSANVPIGRFRAVLGQESISAPVGKGRRYMFISHDYCVEAVTDASGRVALYAVTALDLSFRPTFRYWRINNWKSITIGKTRFAESGFRPDAGYAYTYANRYLYYETYYLAGPGNYQTMFLADNYMGRPRWTEQAMLEVVSFGRLKGVSAKKLRDYRENAAPNTYGFFAPVYGNFAYNRNLDDLLRRSDAGGIWIGATAWDLGSVAGDGAPMPSPSPDH